MIRIPFSLLPAVAVFLPGVSQLSADVQPASSSSKYAYIDAAYLQGPVQEPPDAEANRPRMQASWGRIKDNVEASDALLFLPGLLADRNRRVVYVWGQATGLKMGHECEFLLVAENSGHGYEALAYALARPSDIRQALLFVGLPPGEPVDYSRMRFWPKGERVNINMHYAVPPSNREHAGAVRSDRVEKWLYDVNQDRPYPVAGFIFSGSRFVPDPGNPTHTVLKADAFSPRAIISSYNEAGSLLDVPRQAGKSDTYGTLVHQPLEDLPEFYPLVFTFEPLKPPGEHGVVDLDLFIQADATSPASEHGAFIYTVKSKAGKVLVDTGPWEEAWAVFKTMVQQQQDPYVTLHFNSRLPVSRLAPLCRKLEQAEGEFGLRVEPPPPGHFYYKAFLGNPEYRQRANRPSQPLELRLQHAQGSLSGVLTHIRESWNQDQGYTYKERTFKVPDGAAVSRIARQEAPGITTLFIFVPPDIAYGPLQHFLADCLDAFPVIYVYVERQSDP